MCRNVHHYPSGADGESCAKKAKAGPGGGRAPCQKQGPSPQAPAQHQPFFNRLYKAVAWKLVSAGGFGPNLDHYEILQSCVESCKQNLGCVFVPLEVQRDGRGGRHAAGRSAPQPGVPPGAELPLSGRLRGGRGVIAWTTHTLLEGLTVASSEALGGRWGRPFQLPRPSIIVTHNVPPGCFRVPAMHCFIFAHCLVLQVVHPKQHHLFVSFIRLIKKNSLLYLISVGISWAATNVLGTCCPMLRLCPAIFQKWYCSLR